MKVGVVIVNSCLFSLNTFFVTERTVRHCFVVVVGRNKNSRPTSLSYVVTLELQGDEVRDTVEGLSECWFGKEVDLLLDLFH